VVGWRIKRYRESQRLTQKELAAKMEASRGYLGDIENGTKKPSYNFLKKFLETTGVCSEWILYGTGPMLADSFAPDEGELKDIEFLVDAGFEKLDCGLFAIGDKVFVPVSSISACCGRGFDVFEDYSISDAITVSKRELGVLRSDMLPFAVQTEGRSMEGYGVREGSTVIVNPAEDVYPGCVALAVINEKACVKKIYHNRDGIDLLSSNGEKIHITSEELAEGWGARICGRVMVVISPPDDGI
jgi:phage repressor protein C with HTH and peptisase S24 domain